MSDKLEVDVEYQDLSWQGLDTLVISKRFDKVRKSW